MRDAVRAKKLLAGHTLVLCRGAETIVRDEKGIAPMMLLLERGVSLAGFSAADAVVGKAAAYLFAYAGICEVYARIVSETALETLARSGIAVTYGERVPYIINRRGDGRCPMESAVWDVEEAAAAYGILKERFGAMRRKEE